MAWPQPPELMPRDPLAWLPLLRHWTHCLGEGWSDVQRSLRHDPEGAFRLLYYGLALRGLASSTGLHGDGWLETPSRLVIQLLGEGARAGGLRLGLYLPEQGQQAGDAISQVLKPGLNTFVVPCSALPAQSVVVLKLSGEPLAQPANASDQRRLMAVLAEPELLQQHCQGLAQLEPVAGGVCEEESVLSNKASIRDSSSASRLFSSFSCAISFSTNFVRLSLSSSLCSMS